MRLKGQSQDPDETTSIQQRPPVYGTSARLGHVEFLRARIGSDHGFSPHSHPTYAIGAVRHGACRIWHRGASAVARPGDLVLINPGEPHSADSADSEAWDYCAIYFSVATAVHVRSLAPAGRVVPLTGFVRHDPGTAARLISLCRTLEADPESAEAESAFAGVVRTLFTQFAGPSGDARDGVEHDDNERARQFIEANFASHVRLDEVAELTGQSLFRLIRRFSLKYGMPPYTYLTHLRVAHACELLKRGRAISDTALSVGFSDQSHLTRAFGRIIGVPPGAYARAMRRLSPAA